MNAPDLVSFLPQPVTGRYFRIVPIDTQMETVCFDVVIVGYETESTNPRGIVKKTYIIMILI